MPSSISPPLRADERARRGPHSPPRAEWRIEAAKPEAWDRLLLEHDGGFFHSPSALRVSLPQGRPVWASCLLQGRVEGVALGVARGCRLSRGHPHFYFASPPRLSPAAVAAGALEALVDALAGRGAAEIVVDSFDWRGSLPVGERGVPLRERYEYVVDLAPEPAALLSSFEPHHRTRIRRGERDGWTLERLERSEAGAALHQVQTTAAERAAARGERIVVLPAADLQHAPTPLAEPSGLCAFGVRSGGELLAAALIGWGGTRSYYLIGGSTPSGYARAAAPFLHWAAMLEMRALGRRVYNLGGAAPLSAGDDEAGLGLARFKVGFDAEMVSCRGAAWQPGAVHMRVHQVTRWLAGHL